MQKPNHPSNHPKSDDLPVAADRGVEADEDTVIMPAGARSSGRKSGTSAELFPRHLVECLTDGLVAVDMNGRFIEFNPAGAAILGRGAVREAPAKWSQAYGLYLPDMQTPYPHEQLPLVRALHGETTPEVEMYVLNAQCPEGKWLRVRASPIYNDRGKQIGALAIFCDNTDRRHAEQALAAEQRFLRHLIQTQDRDRQLTAYDIHDGVVQLMTGALMRLEAYRGKQGEECDSDDLHAATRQLRDAIDEARRLIGGLRPPEIDEKGVVGAIEYLAAPRNHGPMKVEFIHDLPLRLSSLQETTVFRIVQEALHNAQRHSGSDRARVILRLDGDQVFLEIRDWGKGFDTKTTRMRRYGLRGIEERTRLLGGSVHIESSPGQGTMIRVSLPLNSADAHEVTETET